jgi:hypothetical protein
LTLARFEQIPTEPVRRLVLAGMGGPAPADAPHKRDRRFVLALACEPLGLLEPLVALANVFGRIRLAVLIVAITGDAVQTTFQPALELLRRVAAPVRIVPLNAQLLEQRQPFFVKASSCTVLIFTARELAEPSPRC